MITYLVMRWQRKRAIQDAMHEARCRHLRLEREIRQITECAYPLLVRAARSLKVSRFCFNIMALEMMAEVAIMRQGLREWQRRKGLHVELDRVQLHMMWNAIDREVEAFKVRIFQDDAALKQIEPKELTLLVKAANLF